MRCDAMRCDAMRKSAGRRTGAAKGQPEAKMRMGDGACVARDSRTSRHSLRTQCSEHAFGGTVTKGAPICTHAPGLAISAEPSKQSFGTSK
jgi:hypothetical protein